MSKFFLAFVIILIGIIFASFFSYAFAQDNAPRVTVPDFDFGTSPEPSLLSVDGNNYWVAPQRDVEPPAPFPTPFPVNTSPPNLCQGTTDFFGCVDKLSLVVVRMIMFFAVILATIFVTWSGILYITKSPNKEEISKIHQRLIWAVIGLIVALTAFFFVKILEISISRGITFDIFRMIFVYAQVAQPSPPTELKCGNYHLPSIFSSNQPPSGVWKDCLWFYLGRVLSLLYRLAIVLSAIFLSWAGILYITKPEEIKKIHSRLIWGIIGALIAILSFTIVKLIEAFFLSVVAPGP